METIHFFFQNANYNNDTINTFNLPFIKINILILKKNTQPNP